MVDPNFLLASMPRPINDSGIGAHGSSGGKPHITGTPWDNYAYDPLKDYYVEQRVKRGVTWWKFLGDGSQQSVMNAKAAVDAGCEVTIRLYTEKPHFFYVAPTEIVAMYVAVGVHYFEFGNEPNLGLEVQGLVEGQPVIGHQYVVAMCNQFIANVNSISAAGGITLIPAMSPGDILDDSGMVVCHQSFIKWFQGATFEDGSSAWVWFDTKCKEGFIAVGAHPRGGNHAIVHKSGVVILNYPLDPVNQFGDPLSVEDAELHGIGEDMRVLINQWRASDKNFGATLRTDSTSYQSWELVDDLFFEALGYHLPILATEAGPEPWELWDRRYPRTTLDAHAAIAMELIRRMNPSHPNAARRSLFCLCFWVYDNEGHGSFRAAGWVNNQDTGGDLPIVAKLEAFAATENFVRVWDALPVEPPTPEPTPEEEPTMPTLSHGFLELYNRFPDTVGEPVSEQMVLLRDPNGTVLHARQATTKGELVYYSGSPVQFFRKDL